MVTATLSTRKMDLLEMDPWADEIARSERKVRAMAEAKLRQSPYLPLHEVTCELCAGVLTLVGRVPSYYLKQIAQTVVCSVEGVFQINNQLSVCQGPRGLDRP